jgi:hypothetical protein
MSYSDLDSDSHRTAENSKSPANEPRRMYPGQLANCMQPNDPWQVVTSPVVREVLSAAGRPLDSPVMTFFEPRFRRDFSRVRIHTDGLAAAATNAVNAKAFTIGNTIVFGAGQYSPASYVGRQLLAHELTHVVQQASRPDSNLVHRKPDKTREGKIRHQERIEELAKWPKDAHDSWHTLNRADRNLVVFRMASIYGAAFTHEFLLAAAHSRSAAMVSEYFGRGVGPKPDKLIARGFRLAQKDSVHEWWVHPSGQEIIRNYTGAKPSGAAVRSTEGAVTEPERVERSGVSQKQAGDLTVEGSRELPAQVDPNADQEPIHGPVVAHRHNVRKPWGEGEFLRYRDGTLEFFEEGATKSYLFLRLSERAYFVYGPDGGQLNTIWGFQEEDIP